jgi:ABC-2 type transport system permease protein
MWKKISYGPKAIAGYCIDELKLIVHDSGALLFFVIAMFIYPMLYITGYGNEVVRDLPVAVVDLDHSSLSRQYSRMIDATEQLTVSCKPASLQDAKGLFFDGKVNGVILIPQNFEKDIYGSKQTNVTVYSDASFFLLYKQVYSGANFANGTFAAGVEIKRMVAEGTALSKAMDQQEPVKVDVYTLYNPSSGYAGFVMPGIILVVMQQTLLIGIGVLGGTIREKKKSHLLMEKAHNIAGSIRLIIGKASAYFLVYFFNALFTFIIFHHWFRLPDNGNMLLVFTLFVPYILAVSFFGLAISLLFKERVHAVLFLIFLSPVIVFISGISWPSCALPTALHWFATIFPSTTVVPAYLKIRIAGADFDAVRSEFMFLTVQAFMYFLLALGAFRFANKKRNKNSEALTNVI